MCRHDLTDRQYERLEPLLPPECPPKGSQGGRPFLRHRRVINGLLRPDRTGARGTAPPPRRPRRGEAGAADPSVAIAASSMVCSGLTELALPGAISLSAPAP